MEENRLTGKRRILQWCKFGRRDIKRLDFSIQKNILIKLQICKSTQIYIFYIVLIYLSSLMRIKIRLIC